MAGISEVERRRLLKIYIGVEGGYLGNFSDIGVLEQFYAKAGLDVDPRTYEGTNRAKFEQILDEASSADQGTILRAVLEMHPPNPKHRTARTQELHDELWKVADRLKGTAPTANAYFAQ